MWRRIVIVAFTVYNIGETITPDKEGALILLLTAVSAALYSIRLLLYIFYLLFLWYKFDIARLVIRVTNTSISSINCSSVYFIAKGYENKGVFLNTEN